MVKQLDLLIGQLAPLTYYLFTPKWSSCQWPLMSDVTVTLYDLKIITITIIMIIIII